MDEFSRIRAKTRRNRGHPLDSAPFGIVSSLRTARAASLAALAALFVAPPALASGGHGDPPPAAAPAEPPPPPPPPPPPRPKPPPPQLNGPIAAPEPKPRLRWIADRITGTALGGYDPVAYFFGNGPRLGSRDHQYDWSGTTWQFVDVGSLAAFRDAPEVYAPRFGGRCAFAVANGRPTEGSPRHWLIVDGRLLLFADTVSRAAFLQDPGRLLAEAERRWPALLADLP